MTLELTAPRARYLMRNTRNPKTRAVMWNWLQLNAENRAMARQGLVRRPADYGQHQHDFHQWVIGYQQCTGCGLRLPDEQVAA